MREKVIYKKNFEENIIAPPPERFIEYNNISEVITIFDPYDLKTHPIELVKEDIEYIVKLYKRYPVISKKDL